MPEPARIFLRFLGLLLVLVGLASAVMLVEPGPHDVARFMGESCSYDTNRNQEQCTWLDAARLQFTVFWVALIIGLVLRLVTRPADKGPRTIDLRWLTRRSRGGN